MSSTDQNHDLSSNSIPPAFITESGFAGALGAWQQEFLFYRVDSQGLLTFVSPSVEAMLGKKPSEMIGRNGRDFLNLDHPHQHLLEDLADQQATLNGLKARLCVATRTNGKVAYLAIRERRERDSSGKVIGRLGMAYDVTEHVKAELSLRQSELKYRRLVEDMEKRVTQRTAELSLKNKMLRKSEARYRHVVEDQTEFVVRLLPDWTYSFVNEAYCRYFGQSRDELLGKTFIPTVFLEDRDRLEKKLTSLSPEKPIGTIEHRVYRPDGSIGWTQWTNRALFGKDGQIEEYQSVGRDITDLKLAADTIRKKEAHLAHVSRLATMGELVAGIAHEVHQPLHAAKTFAEAARRNLESGRPESISTAIDCTKEISEAITRTAKIIRHIRAFTTAKPVEFELLDVNQVVEEAAEIIAYETRRARVEIRFDLARDAPIVQADRVQLEQACVNLLMNAYESMVDTPVDQRKVLVCTRRDRRQVKISFQDAGCGVAPVDLERLFDAFYSTKPRGMGMGLSLCKSIAETHAGHVWAEPNDGPGMTFVFALPLSKTLSKRPCSE